MRLRRGPRNIAGNLRVVVSDALGAEAERGGINITRLHRESRPVDGAPVKARRSARLEPATAQAEILQRLAQQNGIRLPGTPRRILLLSAVNQSVEKSSGGDDDRLRAHDAAVAKTNPQNFPGSGRSFASLRMANLIVLDDQTCHFRLLDLQIRLRLQHLAHLQAIGLLVTLRARRPHGRAARSIQQAELDADRVGNLAHDAAERVDFADQMSLGNATHRRIARHLRNQVDVERVERGLQAHARGGHGGLASGMAGTHHHYIELLCELHLETAERPPEKFLRAFLLSF